MDNAVKTTNYDEIRRLYVNYLQLKSNSSQVDCTVLAKEEVKPNGKEHK